MKIKLLFIMVLIAGSFYAGYKAADVRITSSVGIERITIKEKGKTTVISRVHGKKEKKPIPSPIRKWSARYLVDPSEPLKGEVGISYRVFNNISLEGSYRPSEGQVMIGLGVMF